MIYCKKLKNCKDDIYKSRLEMQHAPKKNSTLTEKRSKIVFLVGDAKLFRVNAKRITQKNNVKVRFFPGATT